MTAALAVGSAAFGQALKPYRLHVFRDSGGDPVNVGNVESILSPYTDSYGGQNRIGINNLGVVGGTYEAGEDVYHGFVWFPNNLGVSGMAFSLRTLLDIHDLGVSGEISIVNDVCAGRALVGFLGDSLGEGEAQAFELDLTGASVAAESLHTTSGPYSIAYGTDDGTTATIVGQTSYDCDDPIHYLRAFKTTWSPSGGAGTMAILPKESGAFSSQANDVGRGWVGTDPDCSVRAAFWNGSSTAPHDVGATMPPDQTNNRSWADGISRRDGEGCVTIVGSNPDINHGLAWHGFDDDWCVEDLNDVVLPCGDPPFVIRHAFDINNFRHITVVVLDEVTGERNLGVLSSAADFDGDLKVDGTDRAALYAHYCSSCTDEQLVYDLDCDDDVDVSDLHLLTGTYWSGSALATVPVVCDCAQSEGMSSESLMDEATALALLGFSGWRDFCAWVAEADADAADAACDTLAYLVHGDQS